MTRRVAQERPLRYLLAASNPDLHDAMLHTRRQQLRLGRRCMTRHQQNGKYYELGRALSGHTIVLKSHKWLVASTQAALFQQNDNQCEA